MADMNLQILISAKNQASSVIKGVVGDIAGMAGPMGIAVVGGMAVVGAVAAIGIASTKAAADYQQAMLKVQALTGMTQQDADAMSQAILRMATDVGESPKDLAAGLYFVASAGFRGKDALNVLQLSAEAAKTGMTNTKTVADALTSALNAFGLTGKDARVTMDEMTATVTAGKMEWQNYANVVGKLSVISKASGVSFVEANAALATLTNSGYSARLAATTLGNLFTQLDLKTDSLAKNATKLHISFDETRFKSMSLAQQIAYLNEITGGNQSTLLKLMNSNATALKGFDALSGSIKNYKGNLESLKSASEGAGATAKAWSITQQGFNVQLDKAKAAFEVLLITIGNKLLPVLTGLLKLVSPLITSFATMITNGTLWNKISQTFGGLYQSIILPIVKEFQQVLFTQVIPAMQSIWKSIQDILPELEDLGMIIGAVVIVALHGFIAVWGVVWNVLAGGIKVLSGLISFFVDLFTGKWSNLGKDLQKIGQGLLQILMAPFKGIWDFLTSFFPKLGSFIGTAFHQFVSIIAGIWNGIVGAVKSAINAVIGIINGFIGGIDSIGIDLGPIHIHPSIPKIPYLQTGGYITSGGLAMLHSGETVVPAGVNRSGSNNGNTYNITVVTQASSPDGIAQAVMQKLANMYRAQGNYSSIFSGGQF